MNYSIFRFTLNMHNHRSQAMVKVFKGDTAVKLIITLTDGGNVYKIRSGNVATLTGTRADGVKLKHDCTIVDNTIIYLFDGETTSCSGMATCEITLYDEKGGIITAPKFTIDVDEKEVDGDESISEYTSTSIATVMGVAAKEYAREQQEQARQDNEVVRQESYNNALTKAESAVSTANEAKEKAETAETNSKSAADTANTAKSTSDEAKRVATEAKNALPSKLDKKKLGHWKAYNQDLKEYGVPEGEDVYELANEASRGTDGFVKDAPYTVVGIDKLSVCKYRPREDEEGYNPDDVTGEVTKIDEWGLHKFYSGEGEPRAAHEMVLSENGFTFVDCERVGNYAGAIEGTQKYLRLPSKDVYEKLGTNTLTLTTRGEVNKIFSNLKLSYDNTNHTLSITASDIDGNNYSNSIDLVLESVIVGVEDEVNADGKYSIRFKFSSGEYSKWYALDDIINLSEYVKKSEFDKKQEAIQTSISSIQSDLNSKVASVNKTWAVYGKGSTGQDMAYLVDHDSNVTTGYIVRRQKDGHIYVPEMPTLDTHAISKAYADTKAPKIRIAYRLYGTDQNGNTIPYTFSKNVAEGHIVVRDVGGNLKVPDTPRDDNHATSKAYVDKKAAEISASVISTVSLVTNNQTKVVDLYPYIEEQNSDIAIFLRNNLSLDIEWSDMEFNISEGNSSGTHIYGYKTKLIPRKPLEHGVPVECVITSFRKTHGELEHAVVYGMTYVGEIPDISPQKCVALFNEDTKAIILTFYLDYPLIVEDYQWDDENGEFSTAGGSEYIPESGYVTCTSKISLEHFNPESMSNYVNATVILTEEVAEIIPTSYSLRNRDMTDLELRTLEMLNNNNTEATE